ncbi:quinol:cytochrome C oxidoreductase [Salinibacter sp. 10B]|uniref:c-type cytochrome n=1 Tax=Salinibacter sp. 10B TaxID=1923971 RepID=UPI000D2AE76B|nr:cytochrome c [Salinibacter sp. 10B]PQJ35720.1 quinol:cytochrome C oxidoreductase [Salinibacter sp. 10B]
MRRLLVLGLFATILLVGCRGRQSEAPPIHPHLSMDFQEKFGPQEYNPFFEDGAAMRKPPSGTVPRGYLRANSELHEGRLSNGEYVEQIPVAVNREVLERGQSQYNVYCAPCHGKSGDGNGIIMRGDYGYTPATSYHVDRLRQVTDGYLYDVITNGVRNMPPYAQQIPVRDRWAIVAYIRALQRSQYARPDNLPESVVTRLEEETGVTVRSVGDTTATAPVTGAD